MSTPVSVLYLYMYTPVSVPVPVPVPVHVLKHLLMLSPVFTDTAPSRLIQSSIRDVCMSVCVLSVPSSSPDRSSSTVCGFIAADLT